MSKNKVKYKKIRGVNRRIRHIHQWGENNLNLDIEYLKQYQRDYVKFWVKPWGGITLTNSIYPEPTGKCQQLLIEYLIKIMLSWQKTLNIHYPEFYLNIWLFENHINRSQVVCAVQDCVHFYDRTFEAISNDDHDLGISQSQHYNEHTDSLLDKFEWSQYREIHGYKLNDEDDKMILEDFEPTAFLAQKTINGTDYQMVEIDRVWLIDWQKTNEKIKQQ